MHTNSAEIRRMSQDENRLTLLRNIVKQEEDRDTNNVARLMRFQAKPPGTGFALAGEPGTTAAREHETLRESIASDVDAFIAQGGKVERLETMDKFQMSAHKGYQIIYGSKEGRRQGGSGHG